MTSFRRRLHGLLCAALLLSLLPGVAAPVQAQGIYRAAFSNESWHLTVELLADDLAHFQYTQDDPGDAPIPVSPMVAETAYSGPSVVNTPDPHTLATPELSLAVEAESLCVTFTDLIAERVLTMVCPSAGDTTLSLSLTQEDTTDLYGLGEQFQRRGGTDGNWLGKRRNVLNMYGNELASFNGGNVGNAQFPILYALGAGQDNYAFFFDDIYQQYWDFSSDPWTVTTTNDVLRGYILTGPDLPDLRSDYLALTGRPPVPPRPMFGLWVSEYGYEDWAELTGDLDSLQDAAFPVDGFVLDLYWFGGIGGDSQMGSLTWDETRFPDPAGFIAGLQAEYGLGIMTIEEPYVADSLPDYADLAASGVLVRTCAAADCAPVHFDAWWGDGSMVDWSNPDAAAWWHDNRRQHLVEDGVMGHWTDLGEPEQYSDGAWYYGFPEADRHGQADVHNVYNLLWAQSIWDGYQRNDVARRPFVLSRSGTSGIQRYGVSMWSGDIAANMPSLEAHMNVQMHMALSGIDYFGADVGGFNRQVGDPLFDADRMYTLWLANAALLDVPLRPHASNTQNLYATAPSEVGDVPSNLANVRLRYELSPYYYSLAHLAYRDGTAVIAPLVHGYQADPAVRALGSVKLIGPDLLMATLTGYAIETISVYLPAGGWFDYATHAYTDSTGATVDVPVTVDGLLQAPLFVRDGALIPQMIVDDQTMNTLGQRRDGSAPAADMQISLYRQTAEAGQFTLIEDDGTTLAYQDGAVRETPITFSHADGTTTITLGPASGTYADAPDTRRWQFQVVGADEAATTVTLNGEPLPELGTLDDSPPGWLATPEGLIIALGDHPVSTALTVQID